MFANSDDPVIPSGVVDGGSLLESACSRPHAGYGNAEKYPTLDLKLAALFHSLVKNHAFHNGNKRTALVTLITTLYSNKRVFKTEVSDDDIYAFTIEVAGGEFAGGAGKLSTDETVREMSHWIRSNTMVTKRRIVEMDVPRFVECCVRAGGRHKLSGCLHMITGPVGTVRFNQTTRKLSGPVARKYLRRMGLTESSAGIEPTEFQEGVSEEQNEIRRFRNVLHRLAST